MKMITGIGSAIASTKSHRPLAITASISSLAKVRIQGSSSFTLAGAKAFISGRRKAVCSGGSSETGITRGSIPSGSAGRVSRVLENRPVSRAASNSRS